MATRLVSCRREGGDRDVLGQTVGLLGARMLRLLDRALQVVLRPRDRRVCYFSIPDYTDNAFYLYRHALRTRDGLEHAWLVRDTAAAERIRREFEILGDERPGHTNRLRVARKQSLRGYLLYLTSRHVFHTHGVYGFSDTSRRREVVTLWHGMPIKAIGRLNRHSPNPKPTFATSSIATSSLYRPIIAEVFGLDRDAVEVCGLPRCDALRYAEARGAPREAIRRILGIPDDQRLVLWMPTYRGRSPATLQQHHASPMSDDHRAAGRSFVDDLPPWAFDAIERAGAAYRCTTVIKLHPFDMLNVDGTDRGSSHVRLVTSDEWLATQVQLYDLIAASDALISDVSSVLIDYLVTTRPIGLLGFSEERYDRDLLLPFDQYFGGARFDPLSDEPSLNRFFAGVAAGREVSVTEDDVTTSLYEEFALPSSEAVLRRFSL